MSEDGEYDFRYIQMFDTLNRDVEYYVKYKCSNCGNYINIAVKRGKVAPNKVVCSCCDLYDYTHKVGV